MTVVFPCKSRITAWLQASEYLLDHGDTLNVILEISSPEYEDQGTRAASESIDALYLSESRARTPVYSIHTVAETIFPGWEYVHRGLAGVYRNYADEYSEFMKADPRSWGRYARRLTARTALNGTQFNPLEMMINKMKRARLDGQAHFRACYEIGVDDGPYELPLYDTTRDGRRVRGGPCLMHLSFKLIDEAVHLTALYRNHDYRYKVPGNLLGLSRLQWCVANEIGASVGSLVVHSTLAYISPGGGRGRFATLLRTVRGEIAGPN